MAALILDLYPRGDRNFLFFVNSAQIIEKTKENVLNPASAKHLFAPSVRIDDKPVDIRAVDTFDAVSGDAINIHFTTIQGLHTRLQNPKKNAVTIKDFRDLSVEVPRHEALAQQLHTVHLRFYAAPSVVSALSSPDRAAQVSRCVDRFISGDGPCARGRPWRGVFSRQDDGMGIAGSD